MNESDIFIKNANAALAQYTTLRPKKVVGLLKKGVFKVVTSADIPSNTQIFNSRYVDKVKYTGTIKAYEKS